MRALTTLMLIACSGSDPDAATLDPTAEGPYTVELVDGFSMDLGDRGDFPGVVPALLYVPQGLSEPAHVVLFNHGFAVAPSEYYDTLVHLASWGFVVLAPTWDPGIPTARTHADLAADVVATLDWLQQNPLPVDRELLLDTFGVGGHSRGGKQSIHAATLDPRVGATVNLDPVDAAPPFGDFDPADFPSVTPELMAGLEAPAAILGTGRGAEGPVPCAPPGEDHQAFFEVMKPRSLRLMLPTAGHNDFVDACAEGEGGFVCAACPAGDDPQLSRTLAQGLMVAFYREHLEGDAGFRTWVQGAGVEVK